MAPHKITHVLQYDSRTAEHPFSELHTCSPPGILNVLQSKVSAYDVTKDAKKAFNFIGRTGSGVFRRIFLFAL